MRRKALKKEQFTKLYKKLQIKKVIKKYHFIPEERAIHLKKNRGKNSNNNKMFNEKKSNSNNINNINNNNLKSMKDSKDNFDVLIDRSDIPELFLLNNNNNLNNHSAQIQIKTDTLFFGCEKNTKSCIGQVFNDKPFYYYLNRNTPPCCMEKLKSVFQYIIEELESTGVRYWLDNAALKYAIETNELASNAYEIDISFNINDYNRSTSIRRCFDSRPFTDLAGYYWMKATDGHYMKIQYSKNNEIHVNLLPFEMKKDKMIPKGFYGPKAKAFSIEFLHPISSLYFLGRNVFVPNNVHNYLTVKGFKASLGEL
jgi:hypothetical protein